MWRDALQTLRRRLARLRSDCQKNTSKHAPKPFIYDLSCRKKHRNVRLSVLNTYSLLPTSIANDSGVRPIWRPTGGITDRYFGGILYLLCSVTMYVEQVLSRSYLLLSVIVIQFPELLLFDRFNYFYAGAAPSSWYGTYIIFWGQLFSAFPTPRCSKWSWYDI